MKSGFTLIELLAVIVILAIIALIATPMILEMISDSKNESLLRSANNYIDAVEQAVADKNLNETYNPHHCKSLTNKILNCYSSKEENSTTFLSELKINIEGELPSNVYIEFLNNRINNSDNVLKLKYEDKIVTYKYKKLTFFTKDYSNYLMKVTDNSNWFGDSKLRKYDIESIKFLDEISIPDNYKYLKDVSAKQNESIILYALDDDKDNRYEIYIAQDGGVIANPDSSYLFYHMYRLDSTSDTPIDVTNLDTSIVTNMSYMFGFLPLTTLNLNGFDTSNVTNMESMFRYSEQLITLDISSFDTSNVTNTTRMFASCYKLETIYVGNTWTVANVTSSSNMFYSTSNLVGAISYNNKTDKTYATTDGYLTLKTN